MLAVSRVGVDTDGEGEFAALARDALAAMAERPGYLSGRLARSVDDPELWLLLTEWDGVGSYRRALSWFDVKVTVAALFSRFPGRDEPSAFEVLHDALPGGVRIARESDRAADPHRGRH